MKKYSYKIENLDCANCAQKIEIAISKSELVHNISVNFSTSKLVYELNDIENNDLILKNISKIIKKIENNVYIVIPNATLSSSKTFLNYNLTIVFISIIILIFLFFIQNYFYLSLIISLITYLLVGYEVLMKFIKNILKFNFFDEYFLMSLATIGAFFLGDFKEALGVMIFFKIGQILEKKAVNNSKKEISKLLNIKPEFANLKKGDGISKVNPDIVKINDIIVIKPGEKIPLDCVIISGNSFVNSAAITGESLAKSVKIDDNLLSGMINVDSVLEAKVANDFKNSTITKIIELIENASTKKSKTEKFITRFAKIYTPIVVIFAVIIAFIIPTFSTGDYHVWIYRSLVFLIVSCPCAIIISVPLAFFSGIGKASKNGILIKGSTFIDKISMLKTIVFDKTGTLTTGNFKINNIVSIDTTFSSSELLKYAAIAESNSTHPIAKTICEEYYLTNKNKSNTKYIIKDFINLPGLGIKCSIDENIIEIGNKNFMKQNKYNVKNYEESETVLFIAINNKLSGYIEIADQLKVNSKATIAYLKNNLHLNTHMLTGDNYNVAKKINSKLCLNSFSSNLLPNEKLDKLFDLKKNLKTNENIMFVGDGINDSPVLTASDIGVSMGTLGSDIAIEFSDVVIMNDDIGKIIPAIKISRFTKKIIIQNITFALLIKLVIMILGFFGFVNLWYAVFADVGVTLITVINTLRILKYKIK